MAKPFPHIPGIELTKQESERLWLDALSVHPHTDDDIELLGERLVKMKLHEALLELWRDGMIQMYVEDGDIKYRHTQL